MVKNQDGNNAGRVTGLFPKQGRLDRWIDCSVEDGHPAPVQCDMEDAQRRAKQRVVKERIGQHQHTRDIGGAGMASYIIVGITAFGFGVA